MVRPFIQLFKTPRAQYVFDANKNEIIPVAEETYRFLLKCLNGEADVTAATLDEIQQLRQEGYLATESVVKDICHPYTPFIEDFLSRKVSQMTLQVTQGCNLRCKYCIYSEDINQHQRSHSSKSMDWETAKKAVDFLYAHSIDSEHVTIGFYGGEPLLALPLIRQVVAYSKELFDGKEISYTITSNGTLLTDEIMRFLADEEIGLMISLDGPKEIHDKNRVFAGGGGTFDTIMKNLATFKEIAPDYFNKIQFSMVMDPSNDFDCINEITVSAKDFNQHNINAAIVDRDYDEEEVVFSSEYIWKSRYQNFLAFLSIFGRFPEEQVSAISRNISAALLQDAEFLDIFGPLHQVDVPSGPCIPGQMRLFVNVDGNLFPCERVSETSPVMCIGTLEAGFNIEKAVNLLNVGAITKEACRNCWALRHCSSCAKKADVGKETLSPQYKLSHCESVRFNAYENIRQLIMLNEIGLYYGEQVREKERAHDEN